MSTTVYFDLETGGVEDKHPTIQLAAIAVSPTWDELEVLERKIRFDEAACDPEALRVNGYNPLAWANAVSLREAMHDFDDLCSRWADTRLISKRGSPYNVTRLAGHNIATFDVPRTRRDMDTAGVRFWRACWWYPLDTYALAIWHYAARGLAMPKSFQLQDLREALGIELVGDAHEALSDVRTSIALARVLSAQLVA